MKTETRPRQMKSSPRDESEQVLREANKADAYKDQLHALLYEALETEQGGVLVYETALRCAIDSRLIKEWQQYLTQTKNHVRVVTDVLKNLGLNPDQDTPGRTVVRHAGMSLVKTMEVALMAAKPQAAQIVAAECVVQAETKDHLNWELIGAVTGFLTGSIKETLKKAYDQIEAEEDEHLFHTTGWARELHLQSLGLPAQLPPAEERENVKSEMEAAEVRKQRKQMLAGYQEESSEETSREEGPGVQRPSANRQKRQNRRSVA